MDDPETKLGLVADGFAPGDALDLLDLLILQAQRDGGVAAEIALTDGPHLGRWQSERAERGELVRNLAGVVGFEELGSLSVVGEVTVAAGLSFLSILTSTMATALRLVSVSGCNHANHSHRGRAESGSVLDLFGKVAVAGKVIGVDIVPLERKETRHQLSADCIYGVNELQGMRYATVAALRRDPSELRRAGAVIPCNDLWIDALTW